MKRRYIFIFIIAAGVLLLMLVVLLNQNSIADQYQQALDAQCAGKNFDVSMGKFSYDPITTWILNDSVMCIRDMAENNAIRCSCG